MCERVAEDNQLSSTDFVESTVDLGHASKTEQLKVHTETIGGRLNWLEIDLLLRSRRIPAHRDARDTRKQLTEELKTLARKLGELR